MKAHGVKVDFGKLRKLYSSSPAARGILDHFASRERNWRTTTVDRIQANVGDNVSRGDVIEVFKKLEECGCGEFKVGRKGWSSRFDWAAQMVSVGQAAAGETEQVEEVTEEDLGEEEAETLLKHVYRLRSEIVVTLELPKNLTTTEADRLAQYILTLPFEQRGLWEGGNMLRSGGSRRTAAAQVIEPRP